MKICRITDCGQKEKIAREILEALTDWFEVPETREGYIKGSREQDFFAAEQDGRITGFLCLKETGRWFRRQKNTLPPPAMSLCR